MNTNKLKWILTICVFQLALVAGLTIDPSTQVAKGFRYPDYDDQGQLRFEVRGEEARIQQDGLIHISNPRVTFYESGKAVMKITASHCIFDRVKKTVVSTSSVCVVRSEIVLTGKGFSWDSAENNLEIHQNAKVVLRGSKKAAPDGGK